MKVKAVKDYIDKYTKVLHSKGSIFDVTEGRFNEIQGKGRFLEIIPTDETDPEETKPEEAIPEEAKQAQPARKRSYRRKDR